MTKLLFFAVVILSSFLVPAFGQKKKPIELGGKVINELTFGNRYAWGLGGQVIFPVGGKSSIESGLYFKTRPTHFLIYPQTVTALYDVVIRESNIHLPCLYRFDSRAINFTAGPVLEYLLGWKQVRGQSDIKIDQHDVGKFELITTISISRNFKLKGNWIFEPELRMSAFTPNGDGGYALNFSIRKKIF